MGKAALFMEDPMWAASIPELRGDARKRVLPVHSDCTPIDVESAASHLMPGGTLGSGMAGYEVRQGQIDMLKAIARSFNSASHLMVEAGTGVGKSLAYLIPSALWSYVNDTPVVISTATRNLQSQLVNFDIPRAAKVVEAFAPGERRLRAAVLKGRTNYLCLHSLEELNHDGYYRLDSTERAEMDELVDWLKSTEDGDLDSSPFQVLKPKLCCGGEDCLGRRCPFRSKCFVVKARQRAHEADIIVVNHALAITDAVNLSADILPAYGRIVFDEAHNLEDVATDVFSSELSKRTLDLLLSRIMRPGRGKRGEKGIVGKVERAIRCGTFGNGGVCERIRETIAKIRIARSQTIDAGDALFDMLGDLFTPAKEVQVLRYRCLDGERQYSRSGTFTRYTEAEWSEESLAKGMERFENAMGRLSKNVAELADTIGDIKEPGGEPAHADLAGQILEIPEEIKSYLSEAFFVMEGNNDEYVFWAERTKGKTSSVSLTAAPLSVADKIHKHFLGPKDSVVMCSATLRVSRKFDYVGRRLGFALVEPSRVDALVAASPFDYFRQTLALAAPFLPDPSEAGTERYSAALAPLLCRLFGASRGRGLVLFTSYEMMNRVADLSRPLFSIAGLRLLVQGEALSREGMVAELKASGGEGVVLFGSQSFWEGVDVPGPSLSCVVIARIPFPQMGEPIVEARCERMERSGEKPFWGYFMPEALIKFRQGFGRLVRTRSDVGVVVVADPRIATRNYGAHFRKSISASVHSTHDEDELISRAEEFFSHEFGAVD